MFNMPFLTFSIDEAKSLSAQIISFGLIQPTNNVGLNLPKGVEISTKALIFTLFVLNIIAITAPNEYPTIKLLFVSMADSR